MGRIRKECRVEDCTRLGKSLGMKGGKPFWETTCSHHRREIRKMNKAKMEEAK